MNESTLTIAPGTGPSIPAYSADAMSRLAPLGSKIQVTPLSALSKPTAPPPSGLSGVPNNVASYPTTPPLSPFTKKQLPAFGSQASTTAVASPTGATTSATTGKSLSDLVGGGAARTSSGGYTYVNGNSQANGQNSFNIDTNGPYTSDMVGSNYSANDASNQGASYLDYVRNAMQAYQLPAGYQSALADYNDAVLREQSDQIAGNYMGDTTSFAQGLTARQMQTDELAKLAASNRLSTAQAQYQAGITGANAILGAVSPKEVGIGGSLVSPVNGSPLYSSPYLFRPSAGDVTSLANTLLYTGAAPDMNSALSMAQNMVLNQATGQGVTSGVSLTPNDQNSVYTNVLGQLNQGVPISQIINTLGRSQGARAVAQQAIADFMSANPNYNSQIATASSDANTKAYAEQVTYLNNTQRAFNTANNSLKQLQQFMTQYGINQSNVPIANQVANKVKANLIDPAAVGAFEGWVQDLRTEYAQVLSRGGSQGVTDTVRKQALDLIPDDLSPSQLGTLQSALATQGKNAISEVQSQIDSIGQSMASNPSVASGSSVSSLNTRANSTTAGSSAGNPFSASAFYGGQ